MNPFTLARRSARMNPSIIREILKVTERPGIVTLAGGLPSPDLFPVDAIRAATDRVLVDTPRQALQYAASEGFGPLREWIAADLVSAGMRVTPDQVLVTTGSQQGLDLVAKLLIDRDSPVLVQTPTYLGALQAFTPFEPRFVPIAGDAEGPVAEAFAASAASAASAGPRARAGLPDDRPRFAYLVPNFQNPGGGTIAADRRRAIAAACAAGGVPIVEDNPYGELWYDAPPPPPIAAAAPDRTIYLGSLSKVLSPGLRLGYLVAPAPLYPKLLQAKQAADLHTSGLTQRIAADVLASGLLASHLPAIRGHYRARRDAMEAALQRHLGGLARWVTPGGGMFFWVTLDGAASVIDTMALLDDTVSAGVAFVPGRAFHVEGESAGSGQPGQPGRSDDGGRLPVADRSLRLSFVTAPPAAIDAAVAVVADCVRRRMAVARAA